MNLRKVRLEQRLKRTAKEQGYTGVGQMLRDLYVTQQQGLNLIMRQLMLSEHTLRKLMKLYAIPLRSRGGPNNVHVVLSPELLAEVVRDGVKAVATRLGVDEIMFRARLKALMKDE